MSLLIVCFVFDSVAFPPQHMVLVKSLVSPPRPPFHFRRSVGATLGWEQSRVLNSSWLLGEWDEVTVVKHPLPSAHLLAGLIL